MDTLTLVVNPSSGRGRAGRLLPGVVERLHAVRPDADLRVVATTSYDHAREACGQAVAEAREAATTTDAVRGALLVMGGDGMAHLGVNACARTGVPLGVLPAGTGNDFCRGAGLPARLDDAVEALARTATSRIDVTQLTGNLFPGVGTDQDPAGGARRCFAGSVVSSGYDARVNRHANHMPQRLGGLAYGWAALAELASFHPLTYRLDLDGIAREIPAMFVAVGNAGVFGGGMRVCPDAEVDDGWLDITIVHPVPRATLLRLLPQMYSGRFRRHPAVETLRARRVGIDGDGLFVMADGEELGGVQIGRAHV